MRDPLLVPLVLIVAGLLLGNAIPSSIPVSAWPVAAFAVLAILARNSPWLRKLAGALAVFCGGALVAAFHQPGPAPHLNAGSRELVVVEGCVVEPTVFSGDRGHFTVELEHGARARVSLRLEYGQRVEIEARLREPRNYKNPGGFDNVAYLARRDIYWNASMPRRGELKILPDRCGARWLGWVFALRT